MIKVRLQVERDNLKGDAVELTRKLEDEHSLRNDLEDELQRLRKGNFFLKIERQGPPVRDIPRHKLEVIKLLIIATEPE